MRPRFWFAPYNMYSESVHGLVEQLNGRIIKRNSSTYHQQPKDIVINWGSGEELFSGIRGLINPIPAVRIAISKLRTFERLQASNVPTVEWTLSATEAQNWLQKYKVLGRDSDSGRSGNGITVYREGHIGPHRFYTKYYRKEREFRIHVLRGAVIFQQEKMRKKDAEHVDKYVRSHNRGWCFAFHHLSDNPVPTDCAELARHAVANLGLDFGAVDIGWNSKSGSVAFEVNTAPGIEESSLQAYAGAFRSLAT